MWISDCAGDFFVVSASSPPFSMLFCEAGAGTPQNPFPRFPCQLASCWFLAVGEVGGRLKCTRKGEQGLCCFQLLSAFLLWPALVWSFLRNSWHQLYYGPNKVQVSIILCASCSRHLALSPITSSSWVHLVQVTPHLPFCFFSPKVVAASSSD